MTENTSLEDLVLGYCTLAEGLVEPPAYGAYEVLLPDATAALLGLAPHQKFTFTPEADGSTYIHYGQSVFARGSHLARQN